MPLLLAASSALANDTSAELATGGLVFVRSDAVDMRSEQLTISPSEVQVTYRFFNKTDKPVSQLVAFPLPDITVDGPEWNVAVPIEDPVNFLGFATTVNGQPVTNEVEQKVFALGVDRTAMLRQLGIPLAPQLKTTDDALDALPREKWDELIALGLAETSEYGNTPDGKMKLHLEPRWTLKTTYYWRQIFAPGQETVIEHRYKPSVGGAVGTQIGAPGSTDVQIAAEQKRQMAAYTSKYCMDAGFVAAAAKAQRAAKPGNGILGEKQIDYVLTTGANWAGPIADFTLTVDKGDPANLLSFCATGIKKLSPTRFQVHYTNYTPTANLAILILTPSAGP